MIPGRPRLAAWPTRLPTRTGAGAGEDEGRRLAAAYWGRLALFAALIVLIVLNVTLVAVTAKPDLFPVDALIFWRAWNVPGLYVPDAVIWAVNYQYSPAFAQAIWPLTLLPWPAFALLVSAASVAAYAWLLRVVSMPLRIVALIAILSLTLPVGNIEWVLALVAVAAARGYSAGWAAVLLTKVTPGIGVLWHVGRRDWRAVAVAGLVTLAIVAVSVALDPNLWIGWIGVLVNNATAGRSDVALVTLLPAPGMIVRLPAAGLLVLWGGLTGRAWTIPLAMVLAQPDLNLNTFALLAAVPRLKWFGRSSELIPLRQ